LGGEAVDGYCLNTTETVNDASWIIGSSGSGASWQVNVGGLSIFTGKGSAIGKSIYQQLTLTAGSDYYFKCKVVSIIDNGKGVTEVRVESIPGLVFDVRPQEGPGFYNSTFTPFNSIETLEFLADVARRSEIVLSDISVREILV